MSESAATFTKVKLDRDDGRQIYEVEFYADGVKYEYDIDANSGAIVKQSKETRGGAGQTAPSSSAGQISSDAAKTAAFQHAGIQESSAVVVKVELDRDDGRPDL